ncbi:hypothetical protein BV25DRAFT_1762479, partial [Artomyces pyxidatus]
PFHDSTDVDIVVRSRDHVDFYTHKIFLSYASSYFKCHFLLPPKDSYRSQNTFHIMNLEEDARTIDMMLRFCYPRSCYPEEPQLDGFDAIKHAMQLAKKYSL